MFKIYDFRCSNGHVFEDFVKSGTTTSRKSRKSENMMGMLAQMGEGRSQAKKALKVSKRSALPPFLALDVMRKAGELSQAGEDIVHLEVGQPSSAAPKATSSALISALEQTPTHGYSVAFGVMGLRAQLAQHYSDWYDVQPHTDNIAITVGSSTAFALAFMAAFDEGDKIALPTPGYPAYRNLMEGLGLEAVPLSAGPNQGWRPMLAEMESWEALPDGLMIASPSNPTGQAPSVTATSGISADGSACTNDPPTVPRLRVGGCPTCVSALASSGRWVAINGSDSAAACRTMVPITSASPSSRMADKPSICAISITSDGCARRIASLGPSDCPLAIIRASGLLAKQA